ncbi:putative aldo/keto reductase [Xylariaceae sp. FL0804]|nr:putative aldo/keto reductase [Xylariaceae sp. FL0804]
MPQLVGKEVGPIGYGLMGLTWVEVMWQNKTISDEQAFEAVQASLKHGSNFWNGGEFYGPPERNSLALLEKYSARHPSDAVHRVVLNVKGGVTPGAFESRRLAVEHAALARRQHRPARGPQEAHRPVRVFGRRDARVPLSVTLGVVERDFSTDALENGVAAACAQYGIPLIAYSPIGRGMLTGHITNMMRLYPRFQPANFNVNLQLLAVNWVRSLSRRPGMPTVVVLPIPGSTSPAVVAENSRVVELSDAEMDEIDATLARFTTAGARYPDFVPVDT